MKISEVLIKRIQDFIALTGKHPSAIYLGREEINLLKEWDSFMFHQDCNTPDKPTFYGIRVYEVTVENHIGMG